MAVDRRARITLKTGGWNNTPSAGSLEIMNKPQRAAATDTPAKPAGTPNETPSETPGEKPAAVPAKEIGGRGGLDPTRYGDWEKNGRAVDF
jgi:hypothetical protein